eukprot:CAMPEP_0182528444 /NCGR_PEP_ID=MMETSP1323-20130603/4515_1 /TAXON_ID=236787 /ORGANISM="Florenciella parvula, Strain RCC1693" /LENGTH=464 /DNA_ID=CAMNT_0024737565 /DNA_START=276 /DNA_END=1670 /DNA_ORIENTATION=+
MNLGLRFLRGGHTDGNDAESDSVGSWWRVAAYMMADVAHSSAEARHLLSRSDNATATDDDSEGVVACDTLIVIDGCDSSQHIMATIACGLAAAGLAYSCLVLWKKRILLAKPADVFKGKAKITPPQKLIMILPASSFCTAIGMFLRTVPNKGIALQVLAPFLSMGVGVPGFTYVVFLYMLYWLQVLEVKKEKVKRAQHATDHSGTTGSNTTNDVQTATADEATSGTFKGPGSGVGLALVAPPSPAQILTPEQAAEKNEKEKKMAAKMMVLAKLRKKIEWWSKVICCGGSVVSLVLCVAAAFLFDPDEQFEDPESMARNVCRCLMWLNLLAPWVLIVYFLHSVAWEQVHMLNSPKITAAFNINYNVTKPLVAMVFANGVLELNPLGQAVRDWFSGMFWVLICTAMLLIPQLLDKLLNYTVYRKKEEAKKRWAGVAGAVKSPNNKGGKNFREKAATVKVAPAPAPK